MNNDLNTNTQSYNIQYDTTNKSLQYPFKHYVLGVFISNHKAKIIEDFYEPPFYTFIDSEDGGQGNDGLDIHPSILAMDNEHDRSQGGHLLIISIDRKKGSSFGNHYCIKTKSSMWSSDFNSHLFISFMDGKKSSSIYHHPSSIHYTSLVEAGATPLPS